MNFPTVILIIFFYFIDGFQVKLNAVLFMVKSIDHKQFSQYSDYAFYSGSAVNELSHVLWTAFEYGFRIKKFHIFKVILVSHGKIAFYSETFPRQPKPE